MSTDNGSKFIELKSDGTYKHTLWSNKQGFWSTSTCLINGKEKHIIILFQQKRERKYDPEKQKTTSEFVDFPFEKCEIFEIELSNENGSQKLSLMGQGDGHGGYEYIFVKK